MKYNNSQISHSGRYNNVSWNSKIPSVRAGAAWTVGCALSSLCNKPDYPPCLYIITPCLHINSKFQGCSSNNASLDQTAGRCYWLPEPASDIWQRGPILPLYHQNKLLNMSSTVINTRPGHGCWGWREGGLNLYFHSAVCIVYCIDLLTRDVKAQRRADKKQQIKQR